MTDFLPEELLIAACSRLVASAKRPVAGALSPIPGAAALLAEVRSGGTTRAMIYGENTTAHATHGGAEMFNMAARGGFDAFFLSGGQIDQYGNVNLMGIGNYPQLDVRWSGSFASSFLYFMMPRVILFRWEHSRRTLVDHVDFISSPGTSPAGVFRRGGPIALITDLCQFHFDQEQQRFMLHSIHPGHSLEEVRDNTGFDFHTQDKVTETPAPSDEERRIIREIVAPKLARNYPEFAHSVFGIAA